MQSNQELLVKAILDQYEIDSTHLPQNVLAEIYALSTDLVSSEDIINYTKRIGDLVEKEDKKAELIEALEDEVHIIIHKLKFIAASDRPKVIILDQISPLSINSSKYLQNCITIAGGIPTDNIEEADKIIVCSEDAFGQIPQLVQDPIYSENNAIKLNQLFIINDKNFAKIAGLNYAMELETLAEILQPKYFFYGLEDTTWLQFQLN